MEQLHVSTATVLLWRKLLVATSNFSRYKFLGIARLGLMIKCLHTRKSVLLIIMRYNGNEHREILDIIIPEGEN